MPYNSYPIYTNNNMGEQLPTIVKTTDGIFHAFFNKKAVLPSDRVLYTTKSIDNGQTWSTPVQIDTSTASVDIKIDAGVSGNGTTIVISNPDNVSGHVLVGSNDTYTIKTTYAGGNVAGKLSISGNYVYVIDLYYGGQTYHLGIKYSSNGGSSFDMTDIDVGSQPIMGYAITSNGQNVFVLYLSLVSGVWTLNSTVSTNGGASFGSSTAIENNVYGSTIHNDLAMYYNSGTIYTVYMTGSAPDNITGLKFGTSINGSTYTSSTITGISLPTSMQSELNIKISNSKIYIPYCDSTNNIQLLTSSDGGSSFSTSVSVANQPSNTLTQSGLEIGSLYILYIVTSGGVPYLYISSQSTPGPGPGSTMCFHSDSIVTLKNGKDTHISDINPGDQLIDNNNNILTVTKLLIQPPVEDYYQLDDNTLVTGNHLIKTPDNRTRLAKYSKLKLVKKPTHKCDYHICTDGPNSSHFIPVKNGYYVEVIGKLHPSVRKNES